MNALPADLWVIDTSSLIEIKQVVPRENLKPVFAELTKLVDRSCLMYPKEVIRELDAYKNKRKPDLPCEWARANEVQAANHASLLPDVADILRTWPQLAEVLDSSKTDGIEEADLYVLALALRNKASRPHVIVVTEESRPRPGRMPLSVACGVARVHSENIRAFLQEIAVWPADYTRPHEKKVRPFARG